MNKRGANLLSLAPLRRDMNELFELFCSGASSSKETDLRSFLIDVKETEKDFIVSAEIPGMSEREVTLDLSNRELTITGSKSEAPGTHSLLPVIRAFRRVLTLPADVDADRTVATVRNGVLTVLLPKVEERTPPTISIPIRS